MIYGGDLAVEMPVKDLYDTSLMIASINAAKDLYDQGIKRMDDFNKTYGDFYSPIAKDVDYWYNNTTKRVRDAINYLYANGIDPTRSMEGRSMISRVINGTDVALLARLKLSAEAAKAYLKNRAVLEAEGKFNASAEGYFLRDANGNPRTMEEWDSVKDGVWTRTSPTANQSMHDIIDPLTKDMKPLFNPELSKNGYEYYDITRDKLLGTINPVLSDIKQTPFGAYYYRLYLNKYNGDTALADAAFANDLATASGKEGIYERNGDNVWIHKDSQAFQGLQNKLSRDLLWKMHTTQSADSKASHDNNGQGSNLDQVVIGARTFAPGDIIGMNRDTPIYASSGATIPMKDAHVANLDNNGDIVSYRSLDKKGSTVYPDRGTKPKTYTEKKGNKNIVHTFNHFYDENGNDQWLETGSPQVSYINKNKKSTVSTSK